MPEPVLNVFQPALQVIVEAGYDRSIPFGDPTPAEATGIQQLVLDPILGIIGPLGGLFTS